MPVRPPQMYQVTLRNQGTARSTQSEWMFDTVKSTTAIGTFRSMEKDLATDHGSEPSDHDGDSMYGMPPMNSFNSGGGTRGSDPAYIGILDTVRSMVVIKTPPDEKDVPEFLTDGVPLEKADVVKGPFTPPSQEPPPAYTGSVRSSQRLSHTARKSTDGWATMLRVVM